MFVGDSSAAGVGVDHQDLALATQTSAELARQLNATIEWVLLARSGINTRDARDWLASESVPPADILVLALGVNDVTTQRNAKVVLGDTKALIDDLVRRAGVRAVILNGLPPMHILPVLPQPLRWYSGQCARRLDLAIQEFAKRRPGTAYVSLQWADLTDDMAIDGYHPGAGHYRRWAKLVAAFAATLARDLEHLSSEPVIDEWVADTARD